MKKLYIYLTFICLTFSLVSCQKNFLEESSQDMVRPKTTEALNQIMTGEAYPLTVAIHNYIELLNDDIQSDYNANIAVTAAINKYSPVFTWQKDMFDKLAQVSASSANPWLNYYARIKGCNVVLDYIDQVDGSASEKQNLRGQALALRSYYYFMMVNLFGKPYVGTAVNPETDLGVPLILTAEVTDEAIKRSTVKEVYDQIEKDLLIAIPLLDANGAGNHIYKFNGAAARFLLSKVYLYKGNWDATIKFADEVLQKKSTLKQYNEIPTTTNTYAISSGITSPEVIWAYGFHAELSSMPFDSQSVTRAAFSVSDDLSNSFAAGDLRAKYSFSSYGYFGPSLIFYNARSAKFSGNNGNSKAFRTAEVYLNRAEANIMKAIGGDQSGITKALADINLVRSNRITTATYAPVTITDPQALLTFYKAERRRELCLEDSRWFDLRRWGMQPLSHTIQFSAGSPQVVALQQNDSRYTLGIPAEALSRNPNLIQNP